MRYCGITENFHNAAIAFIEEDGDISYAEESERYSKNKNDALLNYQQIKKIKDDDNITFYEDLDLRLKQIEYFNLPEYILHNIKSVKHHSRYKVDSYHNHHISHAAASYYTRPWNSSSDTVLMTIDGFGEWESSTIMDHKFNVLYKEEFPKSIGEIYAIVTDTLNLKPLEEEYILMGMAAYGQPIFLDSITSHVKEYQNLDNYKENKLKLLNKFNELKMQNEFDFAASIQAWAEIEILKIAKIARRYGSKLCYSGGVAQNILANTKIKSIFDDVWIVSNPSDGGSALGCAARTYALKTGNDRINWKDPYLGFDMGEINAKEVVDYLLEYSYCGIASGRAEFGPRALGNRSLIADPRRDVKDTVNQVKRRQTFRPFAPAILEEYANAYFEGPMNEYMQFSSIAKHDYKSVTHVDGTARVQLVRKNCSSVLRNILEEFYEKTGVPMLLNTSLNIRGKPIINNKYDCFLFEKLNKTKVFYNDIS